MDEKWRVGHVELLEGGLLFGFVLYDQKGRPCVSFGYADAKKANLGHNHVAAAIKDAEQVLARWVVKLITIEAGAKSARLRARRGPSGVVQNSKDTYPSPYTPSYAQRAIKEGWVNGEEVESWGPSTDARRRPHVADRIRVL